MLDDKLEVPAIGLALSHRARVDDLMERATAHRVTLVTGPAGAGKTVACAAWATTQARRRRGRIGWLTVDPQDREPARFWPYLVAALTRAGAITAADADQLGDDQPGSADDLPQRLLDRLAAGPGSQAAVVLDDVHELTGSPVIPGLDELVHHAPADLTLVLAGRHAPGLALAKLRLAGQLADVGPGELACSAVEADGVLTDLGVPAEPEVRSALLSETEGWMAGLRVLSMSLSGSGEPGDSSALGDRELIADYLRDEVIDPLSAESRNVLLRTSLTKTIAPDLAQLLTSDSGAAARLDQLCRDNCLVYPAGEDGTWYRCHPMLRAVLAAELRREHADEVPVLLSRIARWHAARGEVLPALRTATEAGDWRFGAQVLAAESPVTPAQPSRATAWAELEAVLTRFPPDQRSTDATLACALAAARLWQGDPDGALPHLDCAQHVMNDCHGGTTATALWFAALQVMRLARGGADLTDQQELAAVTHEQSASRSEHRAVGLLWLALGCAQLRQLEAGPARISLQHAGSQLAAGGLAALRERARSWEAVAHAWYGDPVSATKIAAEVAEGGVTGEPADLAPILAVSQALAHVARDEPEAASMLVDQADQAAMAGPPQPAGEPRIPMLTGVIRTRIALDEGNVAGARGLVRLLTEAAVNEPSADVAVAVLDAKTSLAAGELERAHTTLAGLTDGRGGPEVAVCQARLLMAGDDDKTALKVLEPLISAPPAAAGAGRRASVSVTDRLSGLLTAVVAHRRLNQGAEAAQRLEEALALAEPDDQAGPFIASGTSIRSALTVLITPSSRCAAFAARILDRFDGRLALRDDRHLAHAVGSPSAAALTESELAVLRFLPSHMTNQEIAEALFLSINTIKTHLSSVYRKLGVTSRRQAIAQGRRLELL